MAKAQRKKVNKNFGTDTRVVVINKESPHFEKEGTIQSGGINGNGEYDVLMEEENGTTIPRLIHANDLDDIDSVREAGEGLTISVNGGNPVDFDKFKERLKNRAKGGEAGESSEEDATADISIIEAVIKEEFCNYKYEVLKGVGAGRESGAKDNSHIVMDDLLDAFTRFNVHLAAIDDVFKHAGVEVKDIDTLHNHELTMLYHVTGFKMKRSGDIESIMLAGSKHISTVHGRIAFATPWIPLDNLSSYKWYNELKAAADNARSEVKLYKEGKYRIVEEEEETTKPNPKQLTIGDAIAEASRKEQAEEELESEFEEGKV